MKTLDYFRRFFATLFGFILFGVAGVLFKIALLPYTLKSTKGDIKRQLEARRMIGKVWRFFVGYLQWSGVLSVRFNGLEKLGRPGQLILANHPSLLDVVLLISHYSEPNVLVKKDLLHNPSMKSQIIASGYIPNDESMEMLEEIDAVFKSGQSLLIFPEGTRTGWDGQVKMHRGAVSLGLRSASVITPVCIKMTPPNFKKGQPWYKIPPQKIHYEITVGDDILPEEWLAEKTPAHRRTPFKRIPARLFYKENHMSNLENQIKQLIIDSLGLEDITVADIGSEDPLFGDDGLGLDSVDALELGLAVQKTFGFQLDGENDNLRENFANVKTLAEFVKSRQA